MRNVRIANGQHEALTELAAARGTSVNQEVRDAVNRHVDLGRLDPGTERQLSANMRALEAEVERALAEGKRMVEGGARGAP